LKDQLCNHVCKSEHSFWRNKCSYSTFIVSSKLKVVNFSFLTNHSNSRVGFSRVVFSLDRGPEFFRRTSHPLDAGSIALQN
jgi:hypothetical protein